MKTSKGFTLIELLIVIGIIALLAGIVIVAINPARQFAQARNAQRWSNVNAILNAVGQRMADNRGLWNSVCDAVNVTLPTSTTNIGSGMGLVNLEPCLVPTFLPQMVQDPVGGTAADTRYQIMQDATTGRITVNAVGSELGMAINATR